MLLTASIGWAVNSSWLYERGFEKYNVSQTTGLAKSELDKVATGLTSYFRSADANINLTVVKDGKPFELIAGQAIIMPANHPHALEAIERFKMVLIMIRA